MTDTPYNESTYGAQVHRRIQEQLRARQATEDMLIKAMGWTRQRYLMSFIGPRGPSLQTLAQFAQAIGCDTSDLVINIEVHHGR